MALWINDSGASTEEITRGIEAAKAVFARYSITADSAAEAQRKVDAGEPVSPQEVARAVAWGEADAAAVRACCAGWASIPDAAYLSLE